MAVRIGWWSVVRRGRLPESVAKCTRECSSSVSVDLKAVSIYDKCSIGPSIRLICTRCCFTLIWSRCVVIFIEPRVFDTNTRQDEIEAK